MTSILSKCNIYFSFIFKIFDLQSPFFFQSYTIESIRDLLSMNGIKSCHEQL